MNSDMSNVWGMGFHGIIFAAENKSNPGKTAVKVHRYEQAYLRECAAYHLLADLGVANILDFHVPTMLRKDDELRAIEMTIVTRPFVLDFAGAYLWSPPDFTPEAWEQWEKDKEEQFESHWPRAKQALGRLASYGIHMVDVTPGNIAFPA
jgi:hypothetical protein